MRTRLISNWQPVVKTYDGKKEIVLLGCTEWEDNDGLPRKTFCYTDTITGVVNLRLTKTSPIVRVKGTTVYTEGSIYLLGNMHPLWRERLIQSGKYDLNNPLPFGEIEWILKN